ncbi:hypothetical protein BJX76DRAFT_355138 [Aspergillus varians]
MTLPPWSTKSPKNRWKKLTFTDSTTSIPQECCLVEASGSGTSPDPSAIDFNAMVCSDAELREGIRTPQRPAVNGTGNWSFRLIISKRDDSYLADNRPFDLSSSFDLSSFSIAESTLKTVLGELDLESLFLEGLTSLQDDSRFSFAWKPEDTHTLGYILRTERELPSDLILAVSCTAKHDLTTITALIHGCTDKEAQRIMKWVEQASPALQHPSLMALLLAEIQLERHAHLCREYGRRFDSLFSDIQTKARLLTRRHTTPDEQVQDLSEIPDWLGGIFGMHRKHGAMHRYLCVFRENLNLVLDLTNRIEEPIRRDRTAATRGNNAPSTAAIAIVQRMQQVVTEYKDLEQQTSVLKEGASLLLTTMWSLIAQRDSQLAQRANTINQEISTSSGIIAKASGHAIDGVLTWNYPSGEKPLRLRLPCPVYALTRTDAYQRCATVEGR